MTTTVAAEKKDEKVEKRKALGRGLASLLPGPRVVASTEARGPSGGGGGADSGIHGSGDAGETKVPRFARDDKSSEATAAAATRAGAPAPHEASGGDETAEVITIQAQAITHHQMVTALAVELIEKNPYQTRYVFDEEMFAGAGGFDQGKRGGTAGGGASGGRGGTIHPGAGGAAAAGVEDGGEADDPGDCAKAFAAAGGGDDGAGERAAGGF